MPTPKDWLSFQRAPVGALLQQLLQQLLQMLTVSL